MRDVRMVMIAGTRTGWTTWRRRIARGSGVCGTLTALAITDLFGLDDLELLCSQVFSIAPSHVVKTDEQRIVHDVEFLQQGDVILELGLEERLLLRPKLELSSTSNPIEVLQSSSLLGFGLFFWVLSAE